MRQRMLLFIVTTSMASAAMLLPVTIYAQMQGMAMHGSMHTTMMMSGSPTMNASTSGNQSQRIANIKQRASAEINRRLTALSALATKIGNLKKVSSAEKANLTTQIQNQITSLNALSTKIAGDTDLQTLRTDVQSIVASYRIFALFLPVSRMTIVADSMLTINDTITTLTSLLQIKITDAQNKGENVTALQTALTDIQTKLSDEKTQANNVLITIAPLTPQGYPGNKSVLQSAQMMISTGRQDLRAIHQDITTIINGLKSLRKLSITPAMTTVPTANSTTTTTP